MNLVEHIKELKDRLVLSLIVLIICCFITSNFTEEILTFLTKPLLGSLNEDKANLQFLGLQDGFMLYFKVTLLSGLLLAFPIIAFFMAGFINPALYPKEKKAIRPYIILSPILFFLGAVFAYYVIIPLAWKFFLSFNYNNDSLSLNHNITAQKYLTLSINFIFTFALTALLPILLLLLQKFDIITKDWLKRNRKYMLLLAFLCAAVLTPPDVISQLFLAVPMYLLYELSIILSKNSTLDTQK